MGKLKLKGHITVEGLIIFPVVVCMVLLFITFIRLYAVSTQITHAAVRTADKLAVDQSDMEGITAFQQYFEQIKGSADGYIKKSVEYPKYDNKVILSTKIQIPTYLPFISFPKAGIQRQAVSLLWYRPEPPESVWNLPPLERGKVIQKQFGGNLPDFFPVIDIWDGSGMVTLILSIDITSSSYQNPGTLQKLLDSNLSKLQAFDGENYGGIEITREQIHSRKMIIVIPEDCITPEQEDLFDQFTGKCFQNGIDADLIEYQKK